MTEHHHHHHEPASFGRAFAAGIALNLGFVVLELFYGSASHSLALTGDAVHNFSDVLALLLAWGASRMVQRRVTQRYTYGFRRVSILASLVNAVILLLAVGGIAWEAVQRLNQPGTVQEQTVIWVAAVGILINAITAFLFFSGRKNDLNIRGAFMHMAADAGIALGVMLSGVVIMATGWQWLDPVVTLIISAIILVSTWTLLRESVNLALDAVPEGIEGQAVKQYLAHLPNVVDVHDLHIWAMSTTQVALTAHLVVSDALCNDTFLANAAHELHDRFGIEHVTLQRETGDTEAPCESCDTPEVNDLTLKQLAK